MTQRPALDMERMISLVSVARNALGELTSYRELEEAQLLGSSEKLGNIKYQFIVVVEACVDICNHISARSLLKAPESYAHCFELMRERGILRQELSLQMADLARFRNLLVHRYWAIDDRRVVSKLHTHLEFIAEFLNCAAALATGSG